MILRILGRGCLFLAVLMTTADLLATAPPADVEIANYEIEVILDPTSHRLRGSESIRWTNPGTEPTDEIYLHLYLNAFANSKTTFMRELEWRSLRNRSDFTGDWGWIRVRRLLLDDGSDLLPAMEFVRPDDGNQDDLSLAHVQLPRTVEPGATVGLELEFEAQLPGIVARTGFVGDFHLVGQWFPKVAVLGGERGWIRHQFHATSEFFADFGSYLVTITIPEGWVLGATGIEVKKDAPVDGQQTVVYRAERVHDFAWCTAPPDLMEVVETDFEPGRDVPMEWLERARSLLDMSPADLELPPMKFRLMVPKEQREMAPRMVRAARLAVAWFGLLYGAYPYPQLTIVSPPVGAEEAGGMEYPTFITTGADPLDAYPPFSWSSDIEALTVHEFGHQYFQSLLASNEFEEAWLDEGITSYAEISCMTAIAADHLVPEIADFAYWGSERLALSFPTQPVTVGRRAWEYRHGWAYYLASYTKTALALRTVEGLIGAGSMARAMRNYADRFRYRHPTGADLIESLSTAAGRELSHFFDQAVYDDAVADWAVLAVRHRRPTALEGLAWDGAGWDEIESGASTAEDEDDTWIVDVELGRHGEFVWPVEVELRWSDGTTERRTWNSETRWVRWRLEGEQRLDQVVIDPDVVWVLETRRADNYWREAAAVVDHPLWWLREGFKLARHFFLRFS
jgi:hypothetical protein